MASNFDFARKGIGNLLREGRLEVPPNQRSYAWEETHVRNYLEDLNEAIGSHQSDYFLGTVVIVQGNSPTPSIADGQQRIATTSILLARIRDALVELGREQSARSVDSDFLRTIDRDTELQINKLSLNLEDNEYFAGAILRSPLDSGNANIPAPARTSNERLKAASDLVAEFLANSVAQLPTASRAEHLLKWVDYVQKQAGVVVVTVADEIGAYRIFETLNDRGLKASQADILKNYFYSRSGTRLQEAISAWTSVAGTVESLGGDENDRLVTYIRHLWITTEGSTKERELAAAIRKKVTSQAKSLSFLNNALTKVQDYVALSNPHHDKWSAYKPSVRENVGILSEHLQVEQIKPLLFAVATQFSPEEAEKAFGLFVSWSVRFLIYGGRGGLLDQQYSARAEEVGTGKITKATQLRESMAKYVPTDTEFASAFANARVSRAHLARYYLRAIEKMRKNDPNPEYLMNEDVTEINLEHILPLNPSAAWGVDTETAKASQKLLGNMVLLRAGQNKDIANKSFAEKKAVFAASSYETTSEVAKYAQWTDSEIRERQAALSASAVATWPLSFA